MHNEGHRLLDELGKACLLEAYSGAGGRRVKMHDVIRDMALHIMNANSAPCMVKSGLGLEDLPDDEEWLPNLQKGLKVIDLRSTSITKVPKSVMSLKKLNALVLNSDKVIIMGEGKYKIGETFHLPRDMKALWIREYGGTWNISSFMGHEELEELRITGCDEVSTLSGNGGQPEEPEGQLEEQTSPPPRDHCPNLKVVQTSRCPKLKHLLVPRHSCNLYLKKLEKLKIYDCEELESIRGAATDEEESLTSSTLPLPPDAFSQLQSIINYDRQLSKDEVYGGAKIASCS
ncbi:hypothetical protein CRG98_028618 [Punica granatum]|uniref:Uncharacterized protein n=1 Tax=Punica granatum TaxID=22663 RepID=A0A2I0J433_PUNGR|nr:hypothetical protein CRG98_028618 [Punica granatum]